MANNTAGHKPNGATAAVPGRARIVAALAEQMTLITSAQHEMVRLLAELATTPIEAVAAVEQAQQPERMWLPRQVADAWGVDYQTVLGWIRDKELRAVKVGQTYRVPDSECHRFIRDSLRALGAVRAA